MAASLPLLTSGQAPALVYKCTDQEQLACETELKVSVGILGAPPSSPYPNLIPIPSTQPFLRAPPQICLANRQIRESIELQCEECFRTAYACYYDCDQRFSATFSKTCFDNCQPNFLASCKPPEYQFTDAGARGLAEVHGLAAAAVAGAAAALAAGPAQHMVEMPVAAT